MRFSALNLKFFISLILLNLLRMIYNTEFRVGKLDENKNSPVHAVYQVLIIRCGAVNSARNTQMTEYIYKLSSSFSLQSSERI
jgi:hypothetical protein